MNRTYEKMIHNIARRHFRRWSDQKVAVNPWVKKCCHLLAKYSRIDRQISYWRLRDCIKINPTVAIERSRTVVKRAQTRNVNVQKIFNALRKVF